MGWISLTLRDRDLAERLHAWIEAQTDDHGYLPEQVADNVQSPHVLAHWRSRRGATATASPLLWCHAMHVVLTDQLSAGSPTTASR